MASAAVHSFHSQGMNEAKRNVALRIANGTKASSPAAITYRMQHRSFNGIPTDSEGSRTKPFFENINQRDSPFASLTGGVIKNYKFAKELLGQRAQSAEVINSLVNQVPPPEQPLLQLTDVESKSLELNALLNNISDEVEAGNVTSVIVSDLKNVLRLYVSLLPTFDGNQLAAFQSYFQEVEQNADVKSEENPQNKSFATVRDFMGNLFQMTAEYAPFSERSKDDKIAKIRELLKRFFKLNERTRNELSREAARSAAEQVDRGDDGGLPPPPPPSRRIEVAASPQPAAVVEEALGEPAEEGTAPARGEAAAQSRRRPEVAPQVTRGDAYRAEEAMKTALRSLNVSQLKNVYNEVIDYPQPLPSGVTAGNLRQRIVGKLNRDFGQTQRWDDFVAAANRIKLLAER